MKRKIVKPIDFILLSICLIFAIGFCVFNSKMLTTQADYKQLRGTAFGEEVGPQKLLKAIDWKNLKGQNSDIAAWLYVEGTSIDTPVMHASESNDKDFYLHHDFWKNSSLYGCPYIDSRSGADLRHTLVFGHHITGQKVGFSELQRVYEPAYFKNLTRMAWATQKSKAKMMVPLCALKVDASYERIQKFTFDGKHDVSIGSASVKQAKQVIPIDSGEAAELENFHDWLSEIANEASAKSDNADVLIKSSTKAVSLVTCSSDFSGMRERTIVVFVDESV